jgi:hypothetical protein
MKKTGVFAPFVRFTTFLMTVTALSFAATSGYLFYGSGSTAYLTDMTGTVKHTWKAGGSIQCVAYLLEDGSVLFPFSGSCGVQANGAHPHGRIQRIAKDGTITWDYKFCPSGWSPGYDIEPLPNGNILVPADNTSKAGIIYELKPSGTSGAEIVWQFQLPDSLNPSSSSGGMGGGTYINSVSYNPDLDYILVDLQEPVRKFVVIDHSGSGKVVYTYIAGTSGRVHGAKWSSKYYMGTKTLIANADTAAMRVGNLLVVNNTSAVVEVNMKTNTKVKSIPYAFSNNEGSCQRLPNGNTLVQKGMDQTTINEIDDSGNKVASYTAVGRCMRAYWYGADYAGVKAVVATPVLSSKETSTNRSISAHYDAVSNHCYISSLSSNEPFSYRIMSTDGKVRIASHSTGANVALSTADFKSGVYLIYVNSVSGSVTKSFIKYQ